MTTATTRTIKSALVLALCLLFASYATAQLKHHRHRHHSHGRRPGPKPRPRQLTDHEFKFPRQPWKELNNKHHGKVPPSNYLVSHSDIYGRYASTVLPYDYESDKISDWLRPPPQSAPMSDADIYVRRPPLADTWSTTQAQTNKQRRVKPKYRLYADADAQSEAELFAPTTTIKPWKPWMSTTGPYAGQPDIRPSVVFADGILEYDIYDDDEEDFDEEQWGINGSVGSGGAWNLGGSYNTQIGRNGNLNVGGSVGNGGQWGVNVGYTWNL